jgi:LAO/AO transport system kinase
MASILQSVLDGNRLALSRLLTQVENNTPEGQEMLAALFPYTGHAHLIGVTGAPGTGKSSLVNQFALHLRKDGKQVAIVAVDPSSPFTGGAVLGDRVRMRDLAGDNGIFIRSMATRGSLGGLAATTAQVVQVFDAAGFDVILIETVGAGQSEVDIARLAHTTLVIEAPGLGDEIQAIKAGILEIADILVINKADRPGVESTERALRGMLELAHPMRQVWNHHGKRYVVAASPENTDSDSASPVWMPPICKTIATNGSGIAELAEAVARHATHLRQSGDWANRERARLRSETETLLQERLMRKFREAVLEEEYNQVLEKIFQRSLSPWKAVEILLKRQI